MTGEVEEAVWRRPVALPMVDYMGNWRSRCQGGQFNLQGWARAGQGRVCKADRLAVTSTQQAEQRAVFFGREVRRDHRSSELPPSLAANRPGLSGWPGWPGWLFPARPVPRTRATRFG